MVNPLSAVACSVLFALMVGCGGGDDTPSGDGDIIVAPTTPNAVGAPCRLGAKRDCKQTIAELDGIVSCYAGQQTCDDQGRWGPCLKDKAK